MSAIALRRNSDRRYAISARHTRFYRPLIEQLETRDLLAFNLTISTAPTTNVFANTNAGTLTIAASSPGANVSVADIDNALQAGNNVVISSGTTGFEEGNVSTSGFTTHLFNNQTGTTLSIATGSGAAPFFVGSISLSGLQLMNPGSLIVQAGGGVALSNLISAATISISSANNSIDMSAGGLLQANSLSVTAKGHIGSGNLPLQTSVDTLSTNTSSGDGDQFLSENDSTSVIRLDAGAGSINVGTGTFNLAAGDAIGNNSALAINNTAVVNLAANDETIGGLAGNGTVAFKVDGMIQSLFVGGNNKDTNFAGNITGTDLISGIQIDQLQKVGTGVLTLSGSESFTGGYIVQSGKLLLTGSLAGSGRAVFIFGTGVFGGTGTATRPVDPVTGGHLSPGASVGVLTTSSLDLGQGSFFDIEIAGSTAGQFDQINMSGTVKIATTGAGVALNIAKSGTPSLHDGDELVIIKNDGNGTSGDPIQGTFKNLPEGANLGSNFLGTGLTAKISYAGGDGNDVSIKLSPGSLHPWHNDAKGLDVQGDNHIAPNDVVDIINYINAFGTGPVPANAVIGLPFGFLDTHLDNFLAPSDALDVINAINAGQGGEGEDTVAPDNLLALLAFDTFNQPAHRRRG